MTHHMQYLTTVPVTGPTPDTDPEYGRTHRLVSEIAHQVDEIREEVDFDGIETDPAGDVHLTLRGTRVARAYMTSFHADAHLSLGDPR